jgi:hypothetical protein
MKPILLILSFILTIQCHAQKASFREIKLKPNPKYYNAKEPTIVFPVVITKNPKIDKLINLQIKEGIFLAEDTIQNIRAVLNEHINEYGLTDLSYEVSYNGFGVLSFSIYYQGCGAHCSSSYIYFNFDLSTGSKISIDDVILKGKIDSFTNIVRSDKINLLTEYKIEEKKYLADDAADSVTYNWAISHVDEACIDKVSIEAFSISGNLITIFDPCEFPHAIRSQEPTIDLKYSYPSIRQFLTPRFKKLLK